MRARLTSPWPAVTDLFAGLMVAAFGAFAVSSGERIVDQDVLREVQALRDELTGRLVEQGRSPETENCGFDTCIPVDVRFEVDRDVLLAEGEAKVQRLCASYRDVVGTLSNKKEVLLVIEGHTDPTKPRFDDAEANERHNWVLSARRATTVLRTFSQCGVGLDSGYEVSAAGYADSRPVVRSSGQSIESWFAQRRRITLRIRMNQDEIRERLKRQSIPLVPQP